MSLWGWITGAVGSIYNAGGQVTRTIRSTAVNGPSRQVSNITSGVTSFSRSLSRSVSPISNIYNAGRSTMQTIRSTAIKGPSQNLKQSIQSISKISRSNPIGQMGSQTMRQVKNLTKTGKIQQAQPKRNIQQTNNIPSFQDAAGAAFSKIPGVMAISAGVGAASKMMTTNTSKPPSQQPVKSQVQKRNNDYLGTNLRISAPKNLININNIGSLPPINAKLPKSSSSAANNPPKYKASDYSGFSRSAGELGVKTAEISSILGSEKTPYIGIPGKPVETAIQKSVIRVSGGIASLGLFVPPTIESMAKIGIEKGPIALGGAVAGATAAGVSAQAQSFIEHPKTSALDLAVMRRPIH